MLSVHVENILFLNKDKRHPLAQVNFQVKEIVDALNSQDLPIIMGAVLIIATLFILINIFVDIIYGWLDPKIRT